MCQLSPLYPNYTEIRQRDPRCNHRSKLYDPRDQARDCPLQKESRANFASNQARGVWLERASDEPLSALLQRRSQSFLSRIAPLGGFHSTTPRSEKLQPLNRESAFSARVSALVVSPGLLGKNWSLVANARPPELVRVTFCIKDPATGPNTIQYPVELWSSKFGFLLLKNPPSSNKQNHNEDIGTCVSMARKKD